MRKLTSPLIYILIQSGNTYYPVPFAPYDGPHISDNQLGKLYVNGSVAGSNQGMFYPPFQMAPASNLWIGRSQYASDPGFNGLVSDFRLYRGALSDQQVAALAAG